MKKYIVRILLLASINMFINSSGLEQTLPIKKVWGIFTVEDKAILRFKGTEDEAQVLQYSNLGRAEIREIETWKVLREFENVRWVAVSPNAEVAGILYGNEVAQIIELENNTVLKELHNVNSIMFSPKGGYVKVVTQDSTLIIEAETWQIIHKFNTLPSPNLNYSLAEDCFGIVSDNGSIQIIGFRHGEIIQELAESAIKDHGLQFSADGKYVTIVYKNGTSALIELKSWQIVAKFENSQALALSNDSKYLFHKTTDNTIDIIDMHDFRVRLRILNNLFFDTTHSTKYMWTIDIKNTAVQVIELETGKVILEGINNAEECCFTKDGRFIIALSDEVRVYKLSEN